MTMEIKFRAWHKHEGMTTPYAYLNESNGFNQAHISKPTAVMQYTGVNDCNGVEIYEGDIVKHHDASISHIVFNHGCFMSRHKCKYHHGGFDEDVLHCWVPLGVEVIGNIYENPEMMEGGL